MTAALPASDSDLVLTAVQRGFAEWKPTVPTNPAVHVAVLGQDRSGPLLVGHRGVPSVAPENTLAGIRAACGLGIPAIEADVRFTADGVPVLLHDRSVDRTSDGTGNVDEMTLARLRVLDFGAWFGPKFAGQRVPSLSEALTAIAQCGFQLVQLDLKPIVPITPDSALVRIGREVLAAGLLDRTQLASDLPTLGRARVLIPGIRTLTFAEAVTEAMASAFIQAGVEAVGIRFDGYLASGIQLTRLQQAGVTIGVWGAPGVLELNTLSPTPQFVTNDWPWTFAH